MPSCVVKWCKNHSDRRRQDTGITFHIFPQNPSRRERWVKSVQLERHESDWMANNSSRICSIHFKDEDFYVSKKGFRMLNKTAIPICTMVFSNETSVAMTPSPNLKSNLICNQEKQEVGPFFKNTQAIPTRDNENINPSQEIPSTSRKRRLFDLTTTQPEKIVLHTSMGWLKNEPGTSKVRGKSSEQHPKLKVCLVCLNTSCRLYSVHALGLMNTYKALVSESVASVDKAGVPQDYVCTMCAIQLRKARQLAAKCERSQTLLLDVLRQRKQLTLRDIEEISSLMASPKFTTTHFTPNYYDLHINKENLESTNTLRLVETDWKDSHDATDTIYFAIVEDGELKETEELVYDIKVEECDEERDSNMLDDIKLEENDLNLEINHTPFELNYALKEEGDSYVINDILKSDESVDSLNVAGNNEDSTENVISKVKTVFTEDNSKPTETTNTNEKHRGNNKKPKATKKRTPKEKKKRAPKERKKTKKQKWKEQKEARENLLNEHFNVKKLSLEEQILEQKKMKLKSNYVKSPHKCDYCYRGFTVESKYTAHMVKHSESWGPLECMVCHLYFKDQISHNDHVKKHRWRYTCKECPFQHNLSYKALVHIKWHRGNVFRCELCTDAVFIFRSSLLRHRRIHHPSSIICRLCGIGFITAGGLRSHYEWKHVGISMTDPLPEDAPSCPLCDLTFASEAALAKHKSLQHNHQPVVKRPYFGSHAPKSHTCEHCGETFDERYLFKQHLWQAHNRLAPYSGPQTERGRPGVPGLQSVAERRKAMARQCHVCGKILRCEALLRDHMDLHNESVSHPCPECGKQYATRTRMRAHRRLHTARYPCPICHKIFNAQPNCDRHVKEVHKVSGMGAQCRYCPKAFASDSVCRIHELHVHMKKAWPRRVRKKRTDTTCAAPPTETE